MSTSRMGLADKARPFLAYLDDWYERLEDVSLAEVVGDAPERVAVFSIDMVNGFCKEGPLAGPRVGALIAPVVQVFQRAYELGGRAFVVAQDTHDPDTPEFQAYPPHCVAGTAESQTVAELRDLPFADAMTVVEKNSISPEIDTNLHEWMEAHGEVSTFLLVGDCTDLCVYTAAMLLRFQANAFNLRRRVIVPAMGVDTFDTPVSVARQAGILAHDGDLHHVLFLHHMALNGVEVVARVV